MVISVYVGAVLTTKHPILGRLRLLVPGYLLVLIAVKVPRIFAETSE